MTGLSSDSEKRNMKNNRPSLFNLGLEDGDVPTFWLPLSVSTSTHQEVV